MQEMFSREEVLRVETSVSEHSASPVSRNRKYLWVREGSVYDWTALERQSVSSCLFRFSSTLILLPLRCSPSSFPSLCSPPADLDREPNESRTLRSVVPLISFSCDSVRRRNTGALSQHSFIDLHVTETHPEGGNESRLVSPVGPGQAFFCWYWMID